MKLHVHRLVAVVSFGLWYTLLAPPLVFATSYSKPCGDYTPALSAILVTRGASFGQEGGSDIVGGIGDATVRNLLPCTSPSTSNYDGPGIFPVSLQQSGTSNIVQVGWVKCGGPTSAETCGGIPSDGSAHFMYVCDDNSNGVACKADSWAGTPSFGVRYRFRVQYNQLGTGMWDYSIKNLSTGVTKTKSIASSWHLANGAWWGGEVKNQGSTMGPTHIGSNDINMYWMQYMRSSVGTWSVVTDILTVGSLGTIGPHPSWYHHPVYNQNYAEDAINIWTELH